MLKDWDKINVIIAMLLYLPTIQYLANIFLFNKNGKYHLPTLFTRLINQISKFLF